MICCHDILISNVRSHSKVKTFSLINFRFVTMKGDVLEDSANEPKKDIYMLTVDPEDAPNQPD